MLTGKLFKAIAFLLLVTWGAARLPAQVIYITNVPNGPNYGLYFDNTSWFAQPFTTGTNPFGYLLDSTYLGLGSVGAAPPISVSLYSNAASAPGSVYSLLTSSDNLNFTPITPTVLAPSTTYWLVMRSAAPYTPSNYDYTYITFNHSYSSTNGWTTPGLMASSSTGGASWGGSVDPALFSVTASAVVPEPLACLPFGLGLAVLLFVRERRRAPAAA
jgi:hypothetical protein